jgi:DNA modification methylase
MATKSIGFAVANKKISDLQPDTKNANKGTERGAALIESSLRTYGAGRSILIDKHGRIIAGNKTAENFGSIGLEDVLVIQTDGTKLVAVQRMDLDLETDKAAKELAIADNRAGQVSLEWDAEVLQELDVDLAKFWTEDELAALLMEPTVIPELLTDEDDVPPVPAVPDTVLGDLYVMGNHRLLCGDSTCITDVEKLLGGDRPEMVFTDPPYGMSAVSKSGVLSERYETDILNDDSTEVAGDAYRLCEAMGFPMLVFWGANYYANILPPSAAWIVWDKNNGGSDQMDCELAWTNLKGVTRQFTKASEKVNRVHPTQKPVALIEWCFDRYKPGDVVDLFGGSGSTLIACEKTGRKAYLMELDPKYCDVIVKRWEEATGKKAVRHGATP